jgi:predicted nucleotidyltransferase
MRLPTARDRVLEEVDEVVRRLVEHYRPQKVILFGSRAWGTPDRESDVDLLLIKETEVRLIDRRRAVRKLLFETGGVPFALDLLVYTPAEVQRRLEIADPFIGEIIQRGQVLYDAADAGGCPRSTPCLV